jgi:hypothetical protein
LTSMQDALSLVGTAHERPPLLTRHANAFAPPYELSARFRGICVWQNETNGEGAPGVFCKSCRFRGAVGDVGCPI